jgi:hypothetical protein
MAGYFDETWREVMGTELYASIVRAVETVFWMNIPDQG